MYNHELLSVDGYVESILSLRREQYQELMLMLDYEAKKMLATSFKEPLELAIPITISWKMFRYLGAFHFKDTNVLDRMDGKLRYTVKREPRVIRLSYVLIISSLLDNDYSTLLDTLRHEVVHYALYIMGEDACDGSFAFESTLARLGISSAVQPNDNLPVYTLRDRYICRNHYMIEGTVGHSKKDKSYYCPICNEQLIRLDKGFYKLNRS